MQRNDQQLDEHVIRTAYSEADENQVRQCRHVRDHVAEVHEVGLPLLHSKRPWRMTGGPPSSPSVGSPALELPQRLWLSRSTVTA